MSGGVSIPGMVSVAQAEAMVRQSQEQARIALEIAIDRAAYWAIEANKHAAEAAAMRAALMKLKKGQEPAGDVLADTPKADAPQ